MITISGLKVEFGSNLLFGDVSFSIGDKERIALTGRNGAGKSTLLKIIAGLQKPTSGVVAIPTDATVGYLPQQMNVTDNRTVMEEVKTVFGEVDRLRSRLDEVNARLAEATDSESDEYARLVDQMTALNEAILLKESNNYIAEIEKTLIGLGFVRSDFERMTSEFSGGWRMRIELAKLLLRRPDVLLLDEPTNHLDIESIQWLESFLRQKAKAVVLVSHDRAFLDNVTQRTIEISCGKIYDYAVNYSKFVELRRERVEQQLRAYRNQQKQIEETEDFIERFRYKATKAVQVQSRIKQLAKIERIEVDEVDNRQINLRFPPAPRSGDYPVIAEGLSKSYGDHLVFGG
ncbi:MAG: ABC-F family ATP-binding cassette domain-containing protein, partial [Candidatus Limisoma sp.]|nr:ABC-F family ATP-binding cassette domain-containing protein [Candidatus Limisoma sp.]